MFKWQICYTEMSNCYSSQQIPSTSMHLATCVWRSWVVHPSWSSVSLRRQQHPKCEQFFFCTHLSFCKLHPLFKPTNKNLTVLGLESLVVSNSCSLVAIQKWTHVHKNIFLKMTHTITSQNIDFSSWITLHRPHSVSVILLSTVLFNGD